LAEDGWRVIAARKHATDLPHNLIQLGVESLVIDREEEGVLAKVVGRGVDALIDTVAYDEHHSKQLLEVQRDVGALVVISSGSVYRDDRGRTIDEARENGFPRFPDPISEDQPTVEPGAANYSTKKVALEQHLLQSAIQPVTILRPGAVHGSGSRHPREAYFVKRILDGRRVVPLAFSGASRFHTSATANIAELIRVALNVPGTRVLNIGDPEALTTSEIGAAIASSYNHEWRLLRFEGAPVGSVGAHPWCTPLPIVLDNARAERLGYKPVTTYENAVAETCRSIEAGLGDTSSWPKYLLTLFDYPAEDAFIAEREL
jgi:nucleoside-diphosphate-sugar epimerase